MEKKRKKKKREKKSTQYTSRLTRWSYIIEIYWIDKGNKNKIQKKNEMKNKIKETKPSRMDSLNRVERDRQLDNVYIY